MTFLGLLNGALRGEEETAHQDSWWKEAREGSSQSELLSYICWEERSWETFLPQNIREISL